MTPSAPKPDKKRKLGRGLEALLGEAAQAVGMAPAAAAGPGRALHSLPTAYLRPGKYQPRHHINEEAIEELGRSIAEKGVLQPLLVRPLEGEGPDAYEIIAGERRWRAAQKARLHEVPVIVRDLDDRETLEIALVENLQRQDLSAIEEAEGYRRLMDEFSHTQEVLARVVGKSRSHVANTLRLLSLPKAVRKYLEEGLLTAGHGRALINAKDPEVLAKKIIKQGLNVRQVEKLTARAEAGDGAAGKKSPGKDADTIALERDLREILGLKVEVRFRDGRGTLTIHYNDLGQLDDVLARLSRKPRPGMPDRAFAADDDLGVIRDADVIGNKMD